MRRPIDINQLKNLPFGSKVKLVLKTDETKTHICFIFGNKLAFEDGSFDEISNFEPYSNWEFYSLDELGNLMWEDLKSRLHMYYDPYCRYPNEPSVQMKHVMGNVFDMIYNIEKLYNYK